MPNRRLDQQWQQLMSLCENESKFRSDGTHPRLLKLIEVEIDTLARAMGFSDQRIATRDFRAEKEGARILRILVFVLALVPAVDARGQPPAADPSQITIPFLASTARPAALEFEGAECAIARTGQTMTCQFQQVLLTTSNLAPQTCLVTTNRYERTFRKQPGGLWISRGEPEGVCAVSEATTLRDGGGVRWTMEIRRSVGKKDAAPECPAIDETAELLSWENIRRALPCTFIQPGGISR